MNKYLTSSIKEVLEVNGYIFPTIKDALAAKKLPKHVFYNRLARGMPILIAYEEEYIPPKPKAWTNKEITYITSHAGLLSAVEMSKVLGRTSTSVRKKCNSLGLSTHKTVNPKNKLLTSNQLFLIKELLELGHKYDIIYHAFFPHFSLERFKELLIQNKLIK